MSMVLALLFGAVPGRADPGAAERAGARMLEALDLFEKGQWAPALAAAEEARRATPDDPRIGLVRIRALVELGRRDEAERILDEEIWQELGKPRWGEVLAGFSPHILTSWARRVALRRFARGADPKATGEAARAALAGYQAPDTPEGLEHQLAVALVAVRTGPRARDPEVTAAGHALLQARCPPAWAAGVLALAWLPLLLLLPWGARSRALAAAAAACLVVVETQALGAGLAGAWLAGNWTLLLEAPRAGGPTGPVATVAGLVAAGLLGIALLAVAMARGRPAWFRELTGGPGRDDLEHGVRWGLGVVGWLGLLVVAQAAWRASQGAVGFGDAALAILARPDPLLATGGAVAALGLVLRLVLGPWLEEALFRGALFGRLQQAFDWQGAAVLSAMAFALAHGRDPLALTGVGILLAAARHRTGRLWPCVVAHATFNGVALLLALGLS